MVCRTAPSRIPTLTTAGPAGGGAAAGLPATHGLAGMSPNPCHPCFAAHGLRNALGMPNVWLYRSVPHGVDWCRLPITYSRTGAGAVSSRYRYTRTTSAALSPVLPQPVRAAADGGVVSLSPSRATIRVTIASRPSRSQKYVAALSSLLRSITSSFGRSAAGTAYPGPRFHR